MATSGLRAFKFSKALAALSVAATTFIPREERAAERAVRVNKSSSTSNTLARSIRKVSPSWHPDGVGKVGKTLLLYRFTEYRNLASSMWVNEGSFI